MVLLTRVQTRAPSACGRVRCTGPAPQHNYAGERWGVGLAQVEYYWP